MSPSRRRTCSIAAAVAAGFVLAVVAAVWLSLALQPRRLRVEAFGQIQLGMTQAQVEFLLGGPPGDYGGSARDSGLITSEGITAASGFVEKVWCGDNRWIEIYFDEQHRVVGLHNWEGFQREPGPSLGTRLLRYIEYE